MQNTLRTLVDASSLPLSLLIVGVGWEAFQAMEASGGGAAWVLRAGCCRHWRHPCV